MSTRNSKSGLASTVLHYGGAQVAGMEAVTLIRGATCSGDCGCPVAGYVSVAVIVRVQGCSTVTLYTFEGADGTPDTYQTFSAPEAKERGEKYRLRVVANEYEWQDAEVAWDFTPPCADCGRQHDPNGDDISCGEVLSNG